MNIDMTIVKTSSDVNKIQQSGEYETNALIDRFSRIYSNSSTSLYGQQANFNYQYLRPQLYSEYDVMDNDAIIASALDILADESTLKNDMGEVLQIRSANEDIQKILYNLFYDVLNVEFNLWMWIRQMCKYGDFFLKLDIAEKLLNDLYALEQNNEEIYIHKADNSKNPVNISMHPKSDSNAIWSEDGSKIVFSSNRNNGDHDIWFVWLQKKDWEKTKQDWDETSEEKKDKSVIIRGDNRIGIYGACIYYGAQLQGYSRSVVEIATMLKTTINDNGERSKSHFTVSLFSIKGTITFLQNHFAKIK